MVRPVRLRSLAFLAFVFAAVAFVIGASFLAYSLQPPRPPPPSNLVVSDIALVDGNASFEILNVTGGPYSNAGFQITLVVNDFSGGPIAIGLNNSVTRIAIGPNEYRIVWSDSNGDSAVDISDTFFVTGDGGPLPALSYYELDLRWQMQWTAKATWSTP